MEAPKTHGLRVINEMIHASHLLVGRHHSLLRKRIDYMHTEKNKITQHVMRKVKTTRKRRCIVHVLAGI